MGRELRERGGFADQIVGQRTSSKGAGGHGQHDRAQIGEPQSAVTMHDEAAEVWQVPLATRHASGHHESADDEKDLGRTAILRSQSSRPKLTDAVQTHRYRAK